MLKKENAKNWKFDLIYKTINSDMAIFKFIKNYPEKILKKYWKKL
jgi:hypothetical protein